MRAGAFNKKIQIFRKLVNVDVFGAHDEKYESVYTTFAATEYLSGARTEENREIFFTHSMKFTLRSYVDVQNEDRIYYNNNFYRILSINNRVDTIYNDIEIYTELINK